jgi:hypothetical protein
MIIDHIGFGVSDFENSKEFYIKCLEPLGITLIMEESVILFIQLNNGMNRTDFLPAGYSWCYVGREVGEID